MRSRNTQSLRRKCIHLFEISELVNGNWDHLRCGGWKLYRCGCSSRRDARVWGLRGVQPFHGPDGRFHGNRAAFRLYLSDLAHKNGRIENRYKSEAQAVRICVGVDGLNSFRIIPAPVLVVALSWGLIGPKRILVRLLAWINRFKSMASLHSDWGCVACSHLLGEGQRGFKFPACRAHPRGFFLHYLWSGCHLSFQVRLLESYCVLRPC